MYRIKLTSKGQVTLPVEMRRKLGLRTGDVLEIRESPEGYLIQKHIPVSPFDRYVGYLGHKGERKTDKLVDEMRGRE